MESRLTQPYLLTSLLRDRHIAQRIRNDAVSYHGTGFLGCESPQPSLHVAARESFLAQSI